MYLYKNTIIYSLLVFLYSKEDMLNDAPDIAIEDSYSVKGRKGGRRIFAGGCARRPNTPINGKIKCSLNRYLYIYKLSRIIDKIISLSHQCMFIKRLIKNTIVYFFIHQKRRYAEPIINCQCFFLYILNIFVILIF